MGGETNKAAPAKATAKAPAKAPAAKAPAKLQPKAPAKASAKTAGKLPLVPAAAGLSKAGQVLQLTTKVVENSMYFPLDPISEISPILSTAADVQEKNTRKTNSARKAAINKKIKAQEKGNYKGNTYLCFIILDPDMATESYSKSDGEGLNNGLTGNNEDNLVRAVHRLQMNCTHLVWQLSFHPVEPMTTPPKTQSKKTSPGKSKEINWKISPVLLGDNAVTDEIRLSKQSRRPAGVR
jgi:hypothetical protein